MRIEAKYIPLLIGAISGLIAWGYTLANVRGLQEDRTSIQARLIKIEGRLYDLSVNIAELETTQNQMYLYLRDKDAD